MMSSEDQKQVQTLVTQEDIRQIKSEVGVMSSTLRDVHQALIGNPMAKDGGIVQRVEDLELIAEQLEARVVLAEKASAVQDNYLKIIWGLAGGLIMTIISLILSYYFYRYTGAQPPKLK